jgi:hypothetical protein
MTTYTAIARAATTKLADNGSANGSNPRSSSERYRVEMVVMVAFFRVVFPTVVRGLDTAG